MFHFTGLGTVVNCLLIVAGSLAGMLFGRRFPDRVHEIVMDASGLVVFFIGVSGLLSAVYQIAGEGLTTRYTLLIIICLICGSILGELLNIDGAMQRAGNWLERKLKALSKTGNSRLAEGFCMTSILYCTGAMAIVGSLNDALLADPTVLYSKGIIDGMCSIVFASTMGVGVLLSAVSVGLYQGLMTLLATLIQPLLTEAVIAQMSAIGSLIIIGISVSMSGLKKIRIANMLPAIFLPLLWQG
ncbi:MAG: DUF554 domain-containing protein, partial [Firmicutes bacterium]|nr:DUF554 domain-containing protein [Bacillota bacterium]